MGVFSDTGSTPVASTICPSPLESFGRRTTKSLSVRTIYLFMSLSIDGYFEGPNHDLSWHNVDDEFNTFAVELLWDTDLFLWGRRIYQLMESFWPDAADDESMSKDDVEIARSMNHTPKIVYSRTLERVDEKKNWMNVKLVRELDPQEVRRLKGQAGKKIGVGGSGLALSLAREGLINEYMFMVTPVMLGSGTPILKGLDAKVKLEVISSRPFRSGNVLLTYKPANPD